MKPVLTQRIKMHLNGGRNWSESHFDILADGQPTGIRRVKRTNGSPRYLLTQDTFHAGGDVFDVLETRGNGMEEWLLAHLPAKEATP
jgi:hypothetical protein